MSDKVGKALDMICRDFDFSHGPPDHKRDVIERVLDLAGLQIVEKEATGHDESDVHVVQRARNGADAPYNQDTCSRYPWAAAARITYLEGVVEAMRKGVA